MGLPKVSIVIPCYNNTHFVKAAIDSALAQTFSNREIIVIDDGSTHNSLETIRAYGNCIRWETGPNQGAPVVRNRGLELAQGEFIKFLDADDVLLQDCLERQVNQAMQLPTDRKAIIYGDALWADQDGHPLAKYRHEPIRPGEDAIAHILKESPLTSCPLHKREYLLAIGGFDTSLPRGQEYDLHLRLVLSGVDFVYYPGPVYHYRQHMEVGRISNHLYSHDGPLVMFYIIQKQKEIIEAQIREPLSPEIKRIFARRFWSYGRGVLREGYWVEANEYFTAARQLDAKNCIVGNLPYPMLVKLFGPRYAEAAIQKLHLAIGNR